jgi:cyclic-di-GMP-binding protein
MMPTLAFAALTPEASKHPHPEHTKLHELLQALSHENDPSRLNTALLQCFERTLALLPLLERPISNDTEAQTKSRLAAQQAQGLLRNLFHAFIRLAQLRSNETGLFISSRPRHEAFGMALETAWQLACVYARTLTPLPSGFWLSCHRLFIEIHTLGWAKRSLKSGKNLGALYRQIMLLGISASNRLEPQKMALLFKIVQEEARFLDLVQLDQALGEQGAFIYQTDSDEAPRFTQAMPSQEQQVWWTIETQNILKQLSSRLQQLLAQAEDRHFEIQLIGRLLQEWAAPPRRQHFRLRRRNGEQIQLISLWSRCWDIAAGHIDETAPEPAKLNICNISASGLLLQGESLSQPLQAGEILMLRRGGQHWQLGLVRWLSLRGDGLSSECGIELIGRSPEAVHIAPITSLGADTLTPALSLAPDIRRGHSGMLILAGKQYQAMRMFTVHDSRGICKVRATRLMMQTAYYQFIETRLEEVATKAQPEG